MFSFDYTPALNVQNTERTDNLVRRLDVGCSMAGMFRAENPRRGGLSFALGCVDFLITRIEMRISEYL